MSTLNELVGATPQEGFYGFVLRKIAEAIDVGLLNPKAVKIDDDLEKGKLSLHMEFTEGEPE